jgi:hypothetical protein
MCMSRLFYYASPCERKESMELSLSVFYSSPCEGGGGEGVLRTHILAHAHFSFRF